MRSGVIGAFLLLLSSGAFAQTYNPDGSERVTGAGGGGGSTTNMAIIPGQLTPLGCQQITSVSTANGFNSIPTGSTLAALTVETQSVRYRDDGTNPTASIGVLLPPGGPWPYTGTPLTAVKFIQTAATAVVSVCFYK